MIITGMMNLFTEMLQRTKLMMFLNLTKLSKKYIRTLTPNKWLPVFQKIGIWCSTTFVTSMTSNFSPLLTKKKLGGKWSGSTRIMSPLSRKEPVWFVVMKRIWWKMLVVMLVVSNVGRTTWRQVTKTEVFSSYSRCVFGRDVTLGQASCWWTKYGVYFLCRNTILKNYYVLNMLEWVTR